MSHNPSHDLWKRFVNPDLVRLLESLDFARNYVRAEGTRLFDDRGREYTDFLSGFGVHNVGHNHPRVVGALRSSLATAAPSMLNIDLAPETGLLAERLTSLTHASLCRVAFANSGAEAVDIAIRAARAATGRRTILACDGAYHGLTTGALALLGNGELRGPFLSSPDDAAHVHFGDVAALADACERLRPAAFIIEPVQGEGGIHVAPAGYLEAAARVCRSFRCLFVLDEIQTGLGRTGTRFAFQREGAVGQSPAVCPDILLVGKALSGGLVPISAAITTADTWKRAFGKPERCVLASSTFAGGRLACVAGLETVAVLEEEGLSARAHETGDFLLKRLHDLTAKHSVIQDVRGRGLLVGVELRPPESLLSHAIPQWARQAFYAQVVSAILLHRHGFLTQPCSVAPQVLRIEPPLTIERGDIERFVAALDRTLTDCPSQGAALLTGLRKAVLGGGA